MPIRSHSTSGCSSDTTRPLKPIHERRRSPELPNTDDFVKKTGEEIRAIDLFLMDHAGGGYDIVAHGLSVSPRGEQENPDLQFVATRMASASAAPVQTSSGPMTSQLDHMMYPLSYIEADQAMAMLKALGYSTVEFNRQPGDSSFESIYEPLLRGQTKAPTVIKFVDAPKTSPMDPFVSQSMMPGMPPMATTGFGQ